MSLFPGKSMSLISRLQSWASWMQTEFNWVMVLYLEETKYLHQRNSFRTFLKNTKAKTPQATELKSTF